MPPTKPLKQKAKKTNKNVNYIEPVASLGLQQILFFEFYYNFIYIIIQILCFSFKNSFLPYPNSTHLNYEWVLIFALMILNVVKVHIGNLGNKSESSAYSGNFVVLSIGSIIGYVFFIWI
jgi:hypothetical protein